MSVDIPIQRALISVSDKTGIVDFVSSLVKLHVEIISTGGTATVLEESGIEVKRVYGMNPHMFLPCQNTTFSQLILFVLIYTPSKKQS